MDFAQNFLLVVLVPAATAGTRQIIKYSFHWRSVLIELSWVTRVGAALGLSGFPYLIEVNGAADAASYHLEVHAPPELTCAGLTLPAGPEGVAAGTPDTSIDVVAHAVGSYPDGPPAEAVARLQLAVPWAGLRLLTTMVAIFTAVVFGLEQVLPGARDTLLTDTGGAVAILLAAPAIVVALLARPGENAIAAALLLPLRVIVLLCAGLLGAGAASFVGRLRGPYMDALWTLGAWVSLVLAVVLVITGLIVGGSD